MKFDLDRTIGIASDLAVIVAAVTVIILGEVALFVVCKAVVRWADRPARPRARHPGRGAVRSRPVEPEPAMAPFLAAGQRHRFACDCQAGGHDEADLWLDCQAARRPATGEAVVS